MSEAPVERENGNGRRGGIILRFWGVMIELRGLTVIMSAVFLIVAAVLVGLFLHDRDSQSALTRLLVEQTATTQAVQEFTYVITLSQEKRDQLRLQMPDSLRKKLVLQNQ